MRGVYYDSGQDNSGFCSVKPVVQEEVKHVLLFSYRERLITVSGDVPERLWNINKGPNYESEVRPLSAEDFLFAGLIMRPRFTC